MVKIHNKKVKGAIGAKKKKFFQTVAASFRMQKNRNIFLRRDRFQFD